MRCFLFSVIGLSNLILSIMPVTAITETDKKVILQAAQEGQGEPYRETVASSHINKVAVDDFNTNRCSACHGE